MPWNIGLVFDKSCGITWCSSPPSMIGTPSTCDHFEDTYWQLFNIYPPRPDPGLVWPIAVEFGQTNNGFTLPCLHQNYPDESIANMIRVTPLPNTGVGKWIGISLDNFYQLLDDSDNFRCVVIIANDIDYTDPFGARHEMLIRYEGGGEGIFGTPPYHRTIRVYTRTIGADGVAYDVQFIDISDEIPVHGTGVDLTMELQSFSDGRQIAIINGGIVLDNVATTVIPTTGYQGILGAWYDKQFALGCPDPPIIVSADGGELCVPGSDLDPGLMLGWWDATTYSGSGNLLNLGTGGNALDATIGVNFFGPVFDTDHFIISENDAQSNGGTSWGITVPYNTLLNFDTNDTFTIGIIFKLTTNPPIFGSPQPNTFARYFSKWSGIGGSQGVYAGWDANGSYGAAIASPSSFSTTSGLSTPLTSLHVVTVTYSPTSYDSTLGRIILRRDSAAAVGNTMTTLSGQFGPITNSPTEPLIFTNGSGYNTPTKMHFYGGFVHTGANYLAAIAGIRSYYGV